MTTECIVHRGVTLRYHRRRALGDTLVFIHGLTDNAASFARVAKALGGYYDVVTYDLRAHGDSDAPLEGYATADHTDDLIALLDHLSISDATLIGHSLGAEIALEAQIRRPELVQALVLEDPPWQPDWVGQPTPRRELATASWRKWLEHLHTACLQEVIEIGKTEMPHWDPRDITAWAEAKHACRLVALDSVLAYREPWQSKIARISCRTLLVVGEPRKGAIVSHAMAMQAKELSPLLEVASIEGAGHGIHRDRFDAYVNALRQFVRQ